MYDTKGLEYLVGGVSYSGSRYNIYYFSRIADDNYGANPLGLATSGSFYKKNTYNHRGKKIYHHLNTYVLSHSFTPELFLNPSRSITRFIEENNEIKGFCEQTFELMMKQELPEKISIHILPFDEFKIQHSNFGSWSNGILGFSVNGNEKTIFVMQNHLDVLMLVLGHEIGHVLTDTLPNKHDEEAKAFAFSIGWARTIKEHNIANLGLNIKQDLDFKPAKNGLHDIALQFVNFMVKKGRNAFDLHSDLARKYLSIFDKFYAKN